MPPAERDPLTAPETARAASLPTLPLLHATFLLAGLGTMLLGPILPLLSRRWHLADAQSGLLPLAQFCGATLGGSTVSARLSRSLVTGLAAASTGFFLFAVAPQFGLGLAGLLVGGFGIGRTIACTNILAARRPSASHSTSSTLSRLNFSWSFGALLSPLSAAWIASRFGVAVPLLSLACFALFLGLACAVQLRSAPAPAAETTPAAPSFLGRPAFVYFAVLLLVYGGLETSLSVWLTTYAMRYGQSSLILSAYTMVLLLCGLTAGRAFAAWLLLRLPDRLVQRAALGLAMALAAALALAHSAATIASLAVLLGFALAPVFPATFALVMKQRPSANQAGLILAASGIGAATLPWLMGLVSTHTGSLQTALTLPIAAAAILLALTLRTPTTASHAGSVPRFPVRPGV